MNYRFTNAEGCHPCKFQSLKNKIHKHFLTSRPLKNIIHAGNNLKKYFFLRLLRDLWGGGGGGGGGGWTFLWLAK